VSCADVKLPVLCAYRRLASWLEKVSFAAKVLKNEAISTDVEDTQWDDACIYEFPRRR
jgi:hypothetical protein